MWIMVLDRVWNNVFMSWFSLASTVVAANFSFSVTDLVRNLPEPPPKSSQCECFMLKRQICVWFNTVSFLVLTLCCPFLEIRLVHPSFGSAVSVYIPMSRLNHALMQLHCWSLCVLSKNFCPRLRAWPSSSVFTNWNWVITFSQNPAPTTLLSVSSVTWCELVWVGMSPVWPAAPTLQAQALKAL